MYVSTGAGARTALPDRKVAAVIAAMRPLLRATNYDAAMEQARPALPHRPNHVQSSSYDFLISPRLSDARF